MRRLAYIGNFGAAHSTENCVVRGFRQIGWDVGPLIEQRDAHARGSTAVGDEIVEARADLVLYSRAHTSWALTGQHWTDTWRRIEDAGVATAALHLDVFRGLPEREQWVAQHDPLFTMGTVFTADGGSDDFWASHGVNHVWLDPGADDRSLAHPSTHELARARTTIREDRKILGDVVLFTGSVRGYHPAWQFRRDLVDAIGGRMRDHFVCWDTSGDPPDPRLVGGDLTALTRSAHVVVGDNIFADSRDRYWSDRLPETLARGAVMIYPDVPGLTERYGGLGGLPFETYERGNAADAVRAIERLIGGGEGLRRTYALMAREQVAQRHLWAHRVRELTDVLGLA